MLIEHLEWWQLLILAAVGCFAGTMNVLAGGGSLLTLPLMVFLGVPAPIANGTNRIALLTQATTGLRVFWKNGIREWRLALSLSLVILPGAAAGAFFGTKLTGPYFKMVIAGIMTVVMIIMLCGNKKKADTPEIPPTAQPQRLVLGHILMAILGLYGGFIQAGMGFLIMPLLNRVMGLDLVRTNFLKLAVLFAYSPIVITIFALESEIWLDVGLSLAVGMGIGGWIGSKLAVHRGDPFIRKILFSALTLVILKLIYDLTLAAP